MKRSIRAFHLPSLRAERYRAYRYRSSLQEGVIHVRIVKIGELRPHCEISTCQEEANYHYNGGHYCWQHRPAPEYNGLATCADCGRSYYQADGEGCQCHNCWAASLTPPSPPWPGGAA